MTVTAAAAALLLLFAPLNCTSFGRLPRGERLERIERSPQYRDGQFWNVSPSVNRIARRGFRLGGLFKFIFDRGEGVRPKKALPAVKTDLAALGRDENVMVWLGHSSVFLQIDGRRFLIDPVLVQGSPVWFANRPFKGTNIFKPADMPEIDYLLITHDHWDHLDYWTVKKLRERTGKVICGLGVGEDFEFWRFAAEHIAELDWNERIDLGDGFTLHCLPARHSSGRGLNNRNKTLWASWMLETPSRNVYISGDTGYDSHFADIGKRFPKIDLAIMENGQYNENWVYSHLLPDHLVEAVRDLKPKTLFTVHNSKFTISNHRWQEPLENISAAAAEKGFRLVTPVIGEVVYLDDPSQVFEKWWEGKE
ncbi:MAG: MBL fold metallo-hydrolase [Treponema sp.]|nr:MBL fold metallo-hydrolase [Treponema sp.]